jgi:glycosyltransferase involved in cell wall biosynthesis
MGIIDSEKVGDVIGGYHFLFLPSRGENFGHVVLESFMASRPVLISDQTPWLNLENDGCGFDLPLKEGVFTEKIAAMISKDNDVWQKMCTAARVKAEAFCNDKENLERYRGLFLI